VNIVHGLLHALGIARWMTWQVTWSLILGDHRGTGTHRPLPACCRTTGRGAWPWVPLLTGAAVSAMGQHLAWCHELLDRGRIFIDRAISGC